MTLIITTISPAGVTMVGDRRLTASGKIFKEDAGKQGHLSTPDASVLYGYTGVAEVGKFHLRDWVGSTLVNLTGLDFASMMDSFSIKLTEEFKSNHLLRKLSPSVARTTIIFAGYMGNGDPVCALVSNFEDESETPRSLADPTFSATIWRTAKRTPDSSATFLTGNTDGLKFERWRELNELLLLGKSSEALRGLSVELLVEAYSSEASRSTIGSRFLSAYLPSPIHGVEPVPSSRYFSDQTEEAIPALDMIYVGDDGGSFFKEVTIGSSAGDVIVFPRRGRNQPCSCGSGKKYKYCHGQQF